MRSLSAFGWCHYVLVALGLLAVLARAESDAEKAQKLLLKIKAAEKDLVKQTAPPTEEGAVSPDVAELADKLKQLEALVASMGASEEKEKLQSELEQVAPHKRWHGKNDEELHKLVKTCMLLALSKAGAARFTTKIGFGKIRTPGAMVKDVVHIYTMKYLSICLFEASDELLMQFEEDKVTELPEWMAVKAKRGDFEAYMLAEIDDKLWSTIQDVASLGLDHMHEQLGYGGTKMALCILAGIGVVGYAVYKVFLDDKEKKDT